MQGAPSRVMSKGQVVIPTIHIYPLDRKRRGYFEGKGKQTRCIELNRHQPQWIANDEKKKKAPGRHQGP
ncbi:MAG: hypothetical protein KAV83_10795 [Desulfobacterales bacterium]|nr:hypothetical protein [Desulfobacterales bacterium]